MQRDFYGALEKSHPSLWSRQGPRDFIEPDGWKSRIKWNLIRYWTKDTRQPTQLGEWVGAWNRLKIYLVRKWTGEIEIRNSPWSRGKERREDPEFGEAENPNTTNPLPTMSIAMVPDDNGSAVGRGQSRSSSGSLTSGRHSQRRRNASPPLSPSRSTSDRRSNQILVEELNEGPEAAEGAEGLAVQGGAPVGQITQRAEAVKYV